MKTSLLIAGGRDFTDYQLAKEALNALYDKEYLPELEDLEILSGMARGADTMGVKLAQEYRIRLLEFHADWSIGRNAGYKRNMEMRDYLLEKKLSKDSKAIALFFWDGKSRGTAHMICHTREKGIDYLVLDYKGFTLETNIRGL